MKDNNFIFADLSTYNLTNAQKFYSKIFHWKYHSETEGMGTTVPSNYFTAHYKDKIVSGLYDMPQKFKTMNMPSFWMSYIQVDSVEETVNKAKSLNGIVELVEETSDIGKIALIRDPLGAGFTVYEGKQLNSRFKNTPNTLIWNELFVSDMAKVTSFYCGVFNWTLEEVVDSRRDKRFWVKNTQNQKIAAITQISNDLKGDKEYWGVFFGVNDISKSISKISAHGGSLIYQDDTLSVVADPMGAIFHLMNVTEQSQISIQNSKTSRPNPRESWGIKWKAIFGLLLVILSVVTNWHWIWGIFLTVWIFSDLRSGYTHLFESISKKESPILYWMIITMWILLVLYIVIFYLAFIS